MEQVLEGVHGETGVLLVDLGEDGGVDTGDGSLVELLIASLAADLLGELGAGGDGEDVGVVGEEEDLLLGGGLVVGGGSDSHDVASVDVGELELEGEDVPGLGAGAVSESELVGVLVELEDLADLGDNVEVGLLAGGLSEGHEEVRRDHVVLLEVALSPLSDVGKDGILALLEGVVLSRVDSAGVASTLLGEDGPGAVVEDVSVELSLAVVEAEGSSVDTDDVTDSGDDGEVLESLGIQDDGGEVGAVAGALLALDVERGVDDLEGADVSVLVGLVGEGSIDDDTIDVLGLAGGEGSLSKLRVLVL